jgi:hypothetical protein
MDLAKHERAEGAQVYVRGDVTERDKSLIANVLRNVPPGIDQDLALGAVCPYWPNQARERAAWIKEIRRQRGESESTE